LFCSPLSVYASGKAIRGGIPIVFPQFGGGPLPQHGFARNRKWRHGETQINATTGDATTHFHLEDDEETRKTPWVQKKNRSHLSLSLSHTHTIKITGRRPQSTRILSHPFALVQQLESHQPSQIESNSNESYVIAHLFLFSLLSLVFLLFFSFLFVCSCFSFLFRRVRPAIQIFFDSDDCVESDFPLSTTERYER